MIRTLFAAFLSAVILTGCVGTTATAPAPAERPATASGPDPVVSAEVALAHYTQAKSRIEPVAERECRAATRGINCDFLIGIDRRRGQPPNAYQSRTRSGRPTITFTQALLRQARNVDEVAFVMAHEAAHHMLDHLDRQGRDAMTGALILAGLVTLSGGDASAVRDAGDLGAAVGGRAFSKDYELEADALGTVIAHRAGFDPVRGAEFFQRIPDPGDRFLGTHPPNAERIRIVRKTAAGL